MTNHTKHAGSFLTYTSGFLLSIGLTLLAFGVVNEHVKSHHMSYSHDSIVLLVMGLAAVQLIVQLVFFLHLGRESKPRLNLLAFMFMLLVLLIVVVGSLWIMNHLDYHHMEPSETDQYMTEQKDKGF